MSDNERRIRIFEKWVELDDKKEAFYGTKVARMLDGFKVTYYAVNKNYQDLLSAFNSYETNPKFLDGIEITESTMFFNELSRLILNYLSSTYSLLKQGEESSKTEKFEVANSFYSSKMHFLHSNNCFCFCQCLRHIVQHFEQLVLMEHYSRSGVEMGKPPKQSISLRKKDLLELQGNLRPKVEREGFVRYIEYNTDIDLKSTISQYQDLITGFYLEFDNKMRELYASDLKELESISEEIRKVRMELS